jgi:hypothetical protein
MTLRLRCGTQKITGVSMGTLFGSTGFYRRAALKGRIWCPTKIITRVPRMRKLAQHGPVELSEKAKHRLDVLD